MVHRNTDATASSHSLSRARDKFSQREMRRIRGIKESKDDDGGVKALWNVCCLFSGQLLRAAIDDFRKRLRWQRRIRDLLFYIPREMSDIYNSVVSEREEHVGKEIINKRVWRCGWRKGRIYQKSRTKCILHLGRKSEIIIFIILVFIILNYYIY